MLIFYTVKPGDSFFSLAEAFDTTVGEIKRLNGIEDDGLAQGTRLLIRPDEKLHPFLADNTLAADDLSLVQLKALLEDFAAEAPEETPDPEVPHPDCTHYTVAPGDTLFSIAAKFGTTPLILQRANGIDDVKNLQAGNGICVPRVPDNTYIYTVRVGDTPQKVASKFGTSTERIIKTNYLQPDERLLPGSQLLITV